MDGSGVESQGESERAQPDCPNRICETRVKLHPPAVFGDLLLGIRAGQKLQW